MNRRGFLGSLAALAVAPFVPMPRTINWHPEVVAPVAVDPWLAMAIQPSVPWNQWDELDEWYDPLHDPTYGPVYKAMN